MAKDERERRKIQIRNKKRQEKKKRRHTTSALHIVHAHIDIYPIVIKNKMKKKKFENARPCSIRKL
jgi:hypothetical protein